MLPFHAHAAQSWQPHWSMPASLFTRKQMTGQADQCITCGLLHTCRYGPGQSFGKHVDDSVDIGDGMYTEYTLLIYLSGSGSPAAKGKQKGVTKPSPGLLGGETIFYGNTTSWVLSNSIHFYIHKAYTELTHVMLAKGCVSSAA